MEVICIIGATPGPVTATVLHAGNVRQLAMDVCRHPAGGWQARLRGGEWGLRCHAVTTAVLMEASEAFVGPPLALAGEPPLALAGEPPLALAGEPPLALAGEPPLALAAE